MTHKTQRPTVFQWGAVITMLIFVFAYRLAFAVATDNQVVA